MKKLIVLCAGLVLILSCNRNSKNVTVVYDTVEVPVDTMNFQIVTNPDLHYAGLLPCASCGGILTDLTLNIDSMTYILTETYKGKIESDSVFTTRGKYSATPPAPGNPIIYQLISGREEATRYFRESGDTALLMLDKQKKEITGKANYYLKKKI